MIIKRRAARPSQRPYLWGYERSWWRVGLEARPLEGGIHVLARRLTFATLVAVLAMAALLGVASAAFGYSGGVHKITTQRAVDVMQVFDHMEAINGEDDFYQFRRDAGVRYFPQLTNPTTLLSIWLVDTAYDYDSIVGDFGTRNHFWDCDDDLDECPEGIGGVDNAWETARSAWVNAIVWYQAGNLPMAYYHLGAVMHLVEDMAQPAHTNSDLHYTTSDADRYNKDSLEEWGNESRADNMYSWTIAGRTSPGKAFNPPSKLEIIQRVVDRTAWEGRDEFLADPTLINPNDPFNTAQLFYIMYVTNQWANYFASDGESGNKRVRLGWVDYEALGFPDSPSPLWGRDLAAERGRPRRQRGRMRPPERRLRLLQLRP